MRLLLDLQDRDELQRQRAIDVHEQGLRFARNLRSQNLTALQEEELTLRRIVNDLYRQIPYQYREIAQPQGEYLDALRCALDSQHGLPFPTYVGQRYGDGEHCVGARIEHGTTLESTFRLGPLDLALQRL